MKTLDFIMYKFLMIILVANLSISCSSQANINARNQTPLTIEEKDSMYEMHLFLGTASAGQNSVGGYPAGERHAMLVFLRQPTNTEPDWERATSNVEETGWTNMDLQKASKVDPKTLEKNPDGKRAYDEAMSKGKAMIIYTEPLKDGD